MKEKLETYDALVDKYTQIVLDELIEHSLDEKTAINTTGVVFEKLWEQIDTVGAPHCVEQWLVDTARKLVNSHSKNSD